VDYSHYTAEEFAADGYFIEWVKRPDRENSAFWETWQAQNPDKAETLDRARQLVNLWQLKPPPNPETAFTEVWEKIQAERTRQSTSTNRKKTRLVTGWPVIGRWAAVFIGLAVSFTAIYWALLERNTTRYTTRAGETKTIVLPDRSTVVLNANSSLSYANEWPADQAREVQLEGEAFFSITHQQNHRKFLVKTSNDLRVEVLGTTFTVSERAQKTRVVLNSGKVGLYTGQNRPPLIMQPGEMVQVTQDRRPDVIRSQVNPAVYSAWKDNQFVFDNTPLGEIAGILENDFGYQVRFADPSIRHKKMTITLQHRDLNLLLTALAEAHDLSISRKDNRILFEDTLLAK
jgi:transmembrane sensor